MPLSELLGQEGAVLGRFHETIVTLQRRRAGGPDLADLEGDYIYGNDFVPVRWGDRRYLIPEKERLVFCSAVNQHGLPRYKRSGPFSLDDVDLRKPPEGLPEVPQEWAPFLFQKPIAGTITEVLTDHAAILSAGAKDGLKSGMEFVRESRLGSSRVRVLFTETDRSIVRISMPEVGALPDSSPSRIARMSLLPQPLALGERVSSRSSDVMPNS